MLVTSIECDTLNKKNVDLQEELKLIDDKLKSMSVKYNSLEVKKTISNIILISFYKGTFAKKIEEKRFECENVFYRELEQDKIRWKQSSDQIIYDLMYDPHILKKKSFNSILAAKDMKMRL